MLPAYSTPQLSSAGQDYGLLQCNFELQACILLVFFISTISLFRNTPEDLTIRAHSIPATMVLSSFSLSNQSRIFALTKAKNVIYQQLSKSAISL